ncbi:MAG: DUF177 domain-containing protein [Candidatus Omnitrophica bacterium]|nr:DUF177 domain-containing protein [Candidatus Omnitrophota bacterium]
MIKFSVRDITSKGLEINQTIPMEGIGLSSEEIDLRSPITVKANIERVDNTIIAHTKISADYGYMCARCLEDFHDRHEDEYHFDFEVTPDRQDIELGEEIRQEMIMANLPRILCKSDCKGICFGCGVNLNHEKCKCK